MKKKYRIGPSTAIIFLTVLVAILGTMFSILNIEGTLTNIDNNVLTTSTVTFKSILSVDGIKYLFSNIILNFKMYEPLVLLIISLIGISICENSGLIKAKVENLKKYKSQVITFIVLLIGFISSFIGNYSYIILLPLVGIIYKYLNKNGVLGVITLFLGITIGSACNFIYTYDYYQLGVLTQKSANISVDSSYIFNLSSNLYLLIGSFAILLMTLTSLITTKIEYKFDKPLKTNDELVVSKKGLKSVNIALLIMGVVLIYLIVPGFGSSGILLDKSADTYIAKLFSPNAPFKDGILFLIVIAMMICGLIYGKVSGNIKSSDEYNKGLSISFSKTGYVFVLLFFASILNSVIEYTNLQEMLCVTLVEFMGNLNFTGVMLILTLFIITLIISIIMPFTVGKWVLISPVVVPLFMKANLAPSFTQYIFMAADSIGKCISPFFAYFIVMIGFMQKYNETNTRIDIANTIRIIGKVLLLLIVVWLLIIIGWYIIGLPTGINTYPTL